MLFVIGVGNRRQEILVAPNATNVFERTGSFALQAKWIPLPIRRRQTALEQDFMFPTIAKIVHVAKAESLAGLGQNATDHRLGGIDAVEVAFQKTGITVAHSLNIELVQMAIVPTHRRLDVSMQLIERAIVNLNPPPDRRSDVDEDDFELINCVAGHCLGLRLFL